MGRETVDGEDLSRNVDVVRQKRLKIKVYKTTEAEISVVAINCTSIDKGTVVNRSSQKVSQINSNPEKARKGGHKKG